MAQLIILENGFDLQCGLKSSYKSFFESEIVESVKTSELISDIRIKKDCTGFCEGLFIFPKCF